MNLPHFISSKTSPTKQLSFSSGVLQRFILIYTLISIFLILSITWVYNNYTNKLENDIIAHQETFILSTTQALQKEMQVQLMLLQMTTRSKLLSNFLELHDQASQYELEKLFSNLAQTFHRFDQIRLISIDGHERIRVNYKNKQSSIVTNQDLQNKQQSNYFKESINLPAGKVYVSPMELNVEHGKVEVPYKPVIRFATPVINENGKTVGIVVFNYLAAELLGNLREQMELSLNGQGMLLDPNGYWIINQQRSNEWGASLTGVNETFEDTYPEAWKIVKNADNRIYKSDTGIFRYVSINPFNLNGISKFKSEKNIGLSVISKSKKINNWKLVIFLANEKIQESSFFYTAPARVIIISLFIAVAAILLLLLIMNAQKLHKQREDLLIKNELTDLYEDSPCGYHSLDNNGLIVKINQTELNWIGYKKQEMMGKPFSDFLTEDSKQIFKSFIKSLKSEQKVEGVILEIRCKDKSTFFVSTSATALLENGHFAMARTSSFNITDRIKLEKKLAHIANTDELTGISNRRHFFLLANQRFLLNSEISLLMIDADHFKKINDQYGHDVGDQVLKMIASTLQANLPNGAILARLGGEEFVVFLQQNSKQALQLAQQLCITLGNHSINIDNNSKITVTLSIGVATRNRKMQDIDEILKSADEALYIAKSTGRNQAIAAANF